MPNRLLFLAVPALAACSGGDNTGPLADPTPFAVVGGQLMGREVTFHRDIRDYQGHFVTGRSALICGTASCRYTRDNADYSFSGRWQATRQSAGTAGMGAAIGAGRMAGPLFLPPVRRSEPVAEAPEASPPPRGCGPSPARG